MKILMRLIKRHVPLVSWVGAKACQGSEADSKQGQKIKLMVRANQLTVQGSIVQFHLFEYELSREFVSFRV